MTTSDAFILPIVPGSPSLGQWTRAHDYEVWTECRADTAPALGLWEAHGNGVVRIPDNDSVMHVIRSGVAHHVEGVFGYWRASSSDIIWIRAARDGQVHYAMMLGECQNPARTESILWICPSCAHVLARSELSPGRGQLSRFWRHEAEAVAKFNADPAARTCPQCGHVHPLAYGFLGAGESRHDPAGGSW